jgi:hypothetical protein
MTHGNIEPGLHFTDRNESILQHNNIQFATRATKIPGYYCPPLRPIPLRD